MMELGVLVAVIIGTAEIAKGLGAKPKYIPLFNLVFGLILSAFIVGFNQEALLQGVIIGLSASGIYDQSKIFGNQK